MRVCDITKSEQVETRVIVLEVPLDIKAEELGAVEGVRIIHDWELGTTAAAAIEAKDWPALNQATPYDDRKKSAARSAAATKAAVTRQANRAASAQGTQAGAAGASTGGKEKS